LGLAAKRSGSGRVVGVCFGDGATSTGSFHEGANMLALWDLPVVLVCQNNRYAEFTAVEDTMRIGEVRERALAYGMPGVRVDGNDPLALMGVLGTAVERARSGGGPTFVEALTFRFRGHYFGDPQKYIPELDMTAAVAADPVPTFRATLLESGVCSDVELGAMEAAAVAAVEEAVQTVLAAPMAADSELGRDVYADAAGMPV
jgi:TPP-dependent pyruvate/acetoin dehydrogenase alpha subunit